MIKTEFGIIEDIRETQEYFYDPKKYQCVCIDDDIYIDDFGGRAAFHDECGLQYALFDFKMRKHRLFYKKTLSV